MRDSTLDKISNRLKEEAERQLGESAFNNNNLEINGICLNSAELGSDNEEKQLTVVDTVSSVSLVIPPVLRPDPAQIAKERQEQAS